jgi:hypothetical protein
MILKMKKTSTLRQPTCQMMRMPMKAQAELEIAVPIAARTLMMTRSPLRPNREDPTMKTRRRKKMKRKKKRILVVVMMMTMRRRKRMTKTKTMFNRYDPVDD